MQTEETPIPAAAEWEPIRYFDQTKRPLPCLLFLIPLLALYELGTLWIGDDNPVRLRNGADAWMRWWLEQFGMQPVYVLPLALMFIFTVWQLCARYPWRVDGEVMLGMVAESMVFALALLVFGRLQDIAFQTLEESYVAASLGAPPPRFIDVVSYIGAGIYEETLFRLLLLPAVYCCLAAVGVPSLLASTAAVTLSGLAFSGAHYLGPMAEPFVWFSFIFRWIAGLVFAGVFVLRGFGIAVGTHAAYDILVGVLGFRL